MVTLATPHEKKEKNKNSIDNTRQRQTTDHVLIFLSPITWWFLLCFHARLFCFSFRSRLLSAFTFFFSYVLGLSVSLFHLFSLQTICTFSFFLSH